MRANSASARRERILIVLAVAGATILMLGVILVVGGEGLRLTGEGDGGRLVGIGEVGAVAGMGFGLAVLIMFVAERMLSGGRRAAQASRVPRGRRASRGDAWGGDAWGGDAWGRDAGGRDAWDGDAWGGDDWDGDAWRTDERPGPRGSSRSGYGPRPADMRHPPDRPYPLALPHSPSPPFRGQRGQEVLQPTSVISPRGRHGAAGDAYGGDEYGGDEYGRGSPYQPRYAYDPGLADPGLADRQDPEPPPYRPSWHGEDYREDHAEPRSSPPPGAGYPGRWEEAVPDGTGYAPDGDPGYGPAGYDAAGEDGEFIPGGPGHAAAPGTSRGSLPRTDPQPVVGYGEASWPSGSAGYGERYASPEPASAGEPGYAVPGEMPGYRSGSGEPFAYDRPGGLTGGNVPRGPFGYAGREGPEAPFGYPDREGQSAYDAEGVLSGDWTAGTAPYDAQERPVPPPAHGDRGELPLSGAPRGAHAADGPGEPPSPPGTGTARGSSGETARGSSGEKEEKLEQLKDLYMTVEAIGDENVDKHFDELLQRQRELISGYFRETGVGDGASAAGGTGREPRTP